MGNRLCRILKKQREDTNGDMGTAIDRENRDGRNSSEEVLYTTIDHSNATTQRKMEHDSDDGCDYTIINVPSGPARKASVKEEGTDDYVLMS
ncbi:uncharacterized protein si:ch211-214p13.7 isoform X2 [Conger conger]|uniref:uncharacterized protein si:ch211-214p13.7 isoform X2 n=1 Tax=Conger conger TaxID=82655 RepID=UPI002A5ABD2D|nr:uncharacterized protein si:ch211-214p13.7 isoform X2 [Conger conger]